MWPGPGRTRRADDAIGRRGLDLRVERDAPVVVFVDGPLRGARHLLGGRWAGGWQVRPVGDRWRVEAGGHEDPELPARAEVHATGLVAACAGLPVCGFGGGVAPGVAVAVIDAFQASPLGPTVPDGPLLAALDAIAATRRPGPIIVALALSTWAVPPLGRSPIEQRIDALTSLDGVYVVAAAGNHRQAALHTSVPAGRSAVTLVPSPGATRMRVALHVLNPSAGAPLGISICHPDGTRDDVTTEPRDACDATAPHVVDVTVQAPRATLHITSAGAVELWCLEGGHFDPARAIEIDTLGVPASARGAIRIGAAGRTPDGQTRPMPWSALGGPITGPIDAWALGDDVPVPTRDGPVPVRGTSIAAARAAGTIARALAGRGDAPPVSNQALRAYVRASTVPLEAARLPGRGGLLCARSLAEALRHTDQTTAPTAPVAPQAAAGDPPRGIPSRRSLS